MSYPIPPDPITAKASELFVGEVRRLVKDAFDTSAPAPGRRELARIGAELRELLVAEFAASSEPWQGADETAEEQAEEVIARVQGFAREALGVIAVDVVHRLMDRPKGEPDGTD